MFIYEKKLQYPVKIKNTNPKLASIIISQYGGPDGELGASPAVFKSAVLHALSRVEGPANRYWYRGSVLNRLLCLVLRKAVQHEIPPCRQ